MLFLNAKFNDILKSINTLKEIERLGNYNVRGTRIVFNTQFHAARYFLWLWLVLLNVFFELTFVHVLHCINPSELCEYVCMSSRLAVNCLRFRTVSRKCLKALNSTTTPWMDLTAAVWPTWLTWVRVLVTKRMEDFQPWWEQHRLELFYLHCG